MKRSIVLSLLLVVGSLFLVAGPSDAHGFHGRVVVGVGPVWWGPYWWYPPPYYYPPAPPVVVQQEPPVYVEQSPPVAPPAPPPGEWYYCQSAKGYYPTVTSCPEPWVRVPANP